MRDGRLLLLAILLALMALRQGLALAGAPPAPAAGMISWRLEWTELPGLGASLLALLAVVFFERLAGRSTARRSPREAAGAGAIYGLAWTALALGASAVAGSDLAGYLALRASRETLIEAAAAASLRLSRTLVSLVLSGCGEETPGAWTRQRVLAEIPGRWKELDGIFPESYTCVVEPPGRLVLHTRCPELVGRDVSAMEVRSPGGGPARTVRDLLQARGDATVLATSQEGEEQIIGCTYLSRLDLLVGVHVPARGVQRELAAVSFPWILGLGLVSGLVMPLALALLYRSFTRADAGRRRAFASLAESQEKLRLGEERFRLALRGAGLSVWDWDMVSGKVTYDELWPRFLGYEPGEVDFDFEWWRAHVHPDSITVFEEALAAYLEGRKDAYELEYRMRTKMGEWRWIAACGVCVARDGGGRPLRMVGTHHDITARQEAEAALRDLTATLERRIAERTAELEERNADLEAFVHTVSHDLRAPVRALHGFAEALLEDHAASLDAMGRLYALHIADAALRMDALIADLLQYSQLSRRDLPLRTVSLEAVVDEALQGRAAEISVRGAEVRVERPLPAVRGHSSTLVEVVSNLLENALKFVAPGTVPRVRCWAERKQDTIRLWVEDNGIGVAREHQERIFQVFERLHGREAYPGTGVGLAIVRRAAERLGGGAGVESEPGRGSRFWIEIPVEGS